MFKKINKEEETFKFVTLYGEPSCLWDITSIHYRNKSMRNAALKKICEEMAIENFTIEDVKNKIKSIRSTYYLEVDKINKSTRSGASGNTYEPKIKWFHELHSFIKNMTVKRKTYVSKLLMTYITYYLNNVNTRNYLVYTYYLHYFFGINGSCLGVKTVLH